MLGTENLIRRLKREEGLRLKPYKCPAGKLTIGYGTNIEDGITKEEAEALLEIRLKNAYDEVKNALPFFSRLTDLRQEVLVDMCYNMGINSLLGFKKMIAALNVEDYEEAAHQMVDSRWYRQVTHRAEPLVQIMKEG